MVIINMIFISLKWDKYKIPNCAHVCTIIRCNIGIFLTVATMCKPTTVIGNHVVIDVTEAGERMVDINACTCYLTPVITKEKARLYVLKQSSLEPGYNGCGSRIDVIIDSTQESGVIRNVCFLNGNVELQNNTIGNISFVKEFYPNDDRYCIGLRSGKSILYFVFFLKCLQYYSKTSK